MSLASYSDLKLAIADWLERSDLAARIPDFITLAESRLNRLFRGRLTEVNALLAAIPGSRSIALPTTFSEAISVRLADCMDELRFVDPATIKVHNDAARPEFWTIDGGALVFEKPADRPYSVILRHLRRFALSDADPSNPILADYPDLYLFGALLEAAPFLRDADLLGLFQVRYDIAMQEANAKEHQNRAQAALRTDRGMGRSGSFDIRYG